MDDSKLKKIEAELKKARMKRDEWDRKVKDLERKYREAENTCIHDRSTPQTFLRNSWQN